MPFAFDTEVPPTPQNSPTSPLSPKEHPLSDEPLSATSLYDLPESLFATEAYGPYEQPVGQYIEDSRDHEDFYKEMENDAHSQVRIRLPSQDNYMQVVTEVQDITGVRRFTEGLEDRETEDIGGLDGSDLSDIDLDDILALEEEGDADIYRQLDEAIPSTFSGSRPSSMFSLLAPPPPPTNPPPSLYMHPHLKRSHAWVTPAESDLARDPRYRPYRAKRPSCLRTCWMPKVLDGDRSDDGSVIL